LCIWLITLFVLYLGILIIKKTIMTHKILPSGVHAVIRESGRVDIYTEAEWQHLSWWEFIKLKHFS